MPVQTGTNRHQIQLFALEQAIRAEDPVRVIDALVDALDLEPLGFELKGRSIAGCPAFAASCLLKLYLYGYQKRIHSSRQLEKVSSDFASIFTAYNLRRAMSIQGIKELLKKAMVCLFLSLRNVKMAYST